VRQARNYGTINEAHRQSLPRTRSGVDEQQNAAAAQRQPRNYDVLRATQQHVDKQQNSPPEPERPDTLRRWTHYGGMVPQQKSANDWIKQNYEIRMSDNGKTGAGRQGQGTQPSAAELQQAQAAVEEAKRREAAERARLQERDRGGPER
jgi:hypothetical protein